MDDVLAALRGLSVADAVASCDEDMLCAALHACSLMPPEVLGGRGILEPMEIGLLVRHRRVLAARGICIAGRFAPPDPPTPEGLLSVCLLAPLWSLPAEAVIAAIGAVPLAVLRDLHTLQQSGVDATSLEERVWVWRMLGACELCPDVVDWRRNADGTWNVLRPLFPVDVCRELFTLEQNHAFWSAVTPTAEAQGYWRMDPDAHPVMAGGYVHRAVVEVLRGVSLEAQALEFGSDVDIFVTRLSVPEVTAFLYGVAGMISDSRAVLTLALHMEALRAHGVPAGSPFGIVQLVLTPDAARPLDIINGFDSTHCRAYIAHDCLQVVAAASTVCTWLDGVVHALPGRAITPRRQLKLVRLGSLLGYRLAVPAALDGYDAEEAQSLRAQTAAFASFAAAPGPATLKLVERLRCDGTAVFGSVGELLAELETPLYADNKNLAAAWASHRGMDGKPWGDTFCGVYSGLAYEERHRLLDEFPVVSVVDLVCRLHGVPLREPCALTESAVFPEWAWKGGKVLKAWLGEARNRYEVDDEYRELHDPAALALFDGPTSPLLGEKRFPSIRPWRMVRFGIPPRLRPVVEALFEATHGARLSPDDGRRVDVRITWRGYAVHYGLVGIMVDFCRVV